MVQKKNSSNNSGKPQHAYYLSLEFEKMRCFSERQKIDFSDNNSNWKHWTIILGDNGTGKTTLLQILVGMLPFSVITGKGNFVYLPQMNELIYQNNWLSQRAIKNCKVKVKFSFNANDHLYPEMEWSDSFSVGWRNSFFVNCFAYGASRKIGETSISSQSEGASHQTLFDEKMLLINPEEWLLQADYATKRASVSSEKRRAELELVKKILVEVLPDVKGIRFNEKENKDKRLPIPIVEFETPYGWVEAADLSLGYRTSMAWIVDFASRMFDLYPESENPLTEPAVVLIDEIDLHLHPKWQRELLDYLSNLFPNTQFIVTTHSPLIVQAAAARDANIVVCRREGDHVVIDQSVEAVRNWRADQILTSDLFGLETARPKETETLLKERRTILSKPKLTKKDEKRLAELEELIGFLPVSENREDNEAMEIIRKAADWIKTQPK